MAQIEQDPALSKYAGLVLAHPGWHTGVIEIVASRLVEIVGKPTVLLSIGEDGIARGSARSIEGVHITEAIATQKDFLIGFGGHPGAAGLSLLESDISQFRHGFGRSVQNQIGEVAPEPTIQIDAYLPLSEISLDLIDDLSRLAPFGAGNPPLTLAAQNLSLVSHTLIGRTKEHLRLVVTDEAGYHQNVLWWNGAGFPLPEKDTPFDLAFTIQASTYQGKRQLQIQWVDFRYIAGPPLGAGDEIRTLKVVDLRNEINPLATLKSIQTEYDVQIWAEGVTKSKVVGLDRNELKSGGHLVIWTTPPGAREWRFVLNQVQPETIFVFAIDPEMDDAQTFLGRLAGLVKYALNANDGVGNLDTFAGATAQPLETIKLGLLWMEAKGYVQILKQEEMDIYLKASKGRKNLAVLDIALELDSILAETAAYRSYFRTTDKIT